MIQILLNVSESMAEKFLIGAINGLIVTVVIFFVQLFRKKKTEKLYDKDIKKGIISDTISTSTHTPYNNTIEVEYLNTLYDELIEKCNPANFMNPYSSEKVDISNQIYSQLEANKNNISVLIELRNQAINKIALSFSAKELYDRLCEIFNPNNYVGDNYDSKKLQVANKIYAKIQSLSSDIIGLEKIAKDNNIIIVRKNFVPSKDVLIKDEKGNSFDDRTMIILFVFGCFMLIFMLIIFAYYNYK